MLTQLLIELINYLSSGIETLFPTFSFASEYLTYISDALEMMYTFLSSVNCLIPLPDIFLIIQIDLSIRIFKLILFVGNWTWDQILAIIPF